MKEKDELLAVLEAAIREKESIIVTNETTTEELHNTINAKVWLISRKEQTIIERGKVIAEQDLRIGTLRRALDKDGEQYWSDFFEQVVDEVVAIQKGTSRMSKKSIRLGAQRFLDTMNAKVSKKEL